MLRILPKLFVEIRWAIGKMVLFSFEKKKKRKKVRTKHVRKLRCAASL